MDFPDGAIAADDDEPAGFFAGKRAVALVNFFVKIISGGFHAVDAHAPRLSSPPYFGGIYIYQHCDGGSRSSRGDPVDRFHFIEIESPSVSLIGCRRIGVPVADDGLAGPERRSDHVVDKLRARRREKEQLGFLRDLDMLAVQQDQTDLLGESGPSGFAEENNIVAEFLATFDEKRRL